MANSTEYIFGIRPVIEAIRSGKQLDDIIVKKGLHGELYYELVGLLKETGISYKQVPIEALNRISRKNHQGVIAWLSMIEFQNLDNILPSVYEAGREPLVLILNGISDVRNFGAIARSAECLKVDAIVIPEKKSARINADAIKTSAGALLNIPVVKVKSLINCLNSLKNSGLKIVTASEKSETNLSDANLKGPLALIMGSEDVGISKELLELADLQIAISTSGETASLNVSVAAGICLYEINRQRNR